MSKEPEAVQFLSSNNEQHLENSGILDENSLASLVKKLGKDTLAYIPSFLVRAIVGFLFVIIITRIFSPAEYGVYALAISTIGIILLLISSWIQQSTLRYRTEFKEEEKLGHFNRHLLALFLIVSALLIILAAAAYPIFRAVFTEYQRFYWPSVGCILTSFWFTNLCYILIADLRPATYSLFIASNSILAFGIALLWIFLIQRDVMGIIYGLLFSDAILLMPLFLSTRFLYREENRNKEELDESTYNLSAFAKKFAFYGFPMIGWFAGVLVLNMSDRYLIQLFRGSAEVGIYSSNYTIAISIFGLICAPLGYASHALLLKAGVSRNANKQQIQRMVTAFSRYYLLLAIPVLTFMIVCAKDISSILLGADYRKGYIVIPIILLGCLAWNLSMYGQKGHELEERTRTMFIYVAICALVNIILNLFFIPWLGYVGAAITTLIGFSLYPILIYYNSRKGIAWKIPWRSLLTISVASAGMALVIILFKVFVPLRSNVASLLTAGAIGVVVNGLLIYLLKEIKASEWQFVKALLRVPVV